MQCGPSSPLHDGFACRVALPIVRRYENESWCEEELAVLFPSQMLIVPYRTGVLTTIAAANSSVLAHIDRFACTVAFRALMGSRTMVTTMMRKPSVQRRQRRIFVCHGVRSEKSTGRGRARSITSVSWQASVRLGTPRQCIRKGSTRLLTMFKTPNTTN